MLFFVGGCLVLFLFGLFLTRKTAEHFFKLNVDKKRFMLDRQFGEGYEDVTYEVWDQYGNTCMVPLRHQELKEKEYIGNKSDPFNLFVYIRFVYTFLSILPWSQKRYAKNLFKIIHDAHTASQSAESSQNE